MMLNSSDSGTILTRYYIGDQYEKDITQGTAKERLYLGGNAYSAPLVYQNDGNGWNIYYICRDYLGSVVQVTNSGGVSLQELSFKERKSRSMSF